MMTIDRLNKYTCDKCGKTIITIDKEEGVTGMIIQCLPLFNGCGGLMESHWYQDENGLPIVGEPAYEWRKPTKKEFKDLSPQGKVHIKKGGLNIYPINGSHYR